MYRCMSASGERKPLHSVVYAECLRFVSRVYVTRVHVACMHERKISAARCISPSIGFGSNDTCTCGHVRKTLRMCACVCM